MGFRGYVSDKGIIMRTNNRYFDAATSTLSYVVLTGHISAAVDRIEVANCVYLLKCGDNAVFLSPNSVGGEPFLNAVVKVCLLKDEDLEPMKYVKNPRMTIHKAEEMIGADELFRVQVWPTISSPSWVGNVAEANQRRDAAKIVDNNIADGVVVHGTPIDSLNQ
jgi:hypothetical protein